MKKIIDEVSTSIQNEIENLRYSNDKYDFEKIDFLTEKEWKSFLPEPPSNKSISTQKDLLEIHSLTSQRTKKQTDLIMKIDHRVESIFLPELEKFNLEYPKDIVKQFWNVYYPIVTNIKYHFNRARTWQLAPKYGMVIDIIVSESAETPSYPSGHSTYAYILENILSEMYPIHKSMFSSLAETVGWARKTQGVHFQSDIDAAKKLTNIIYPKIRDYLIQENKNATSK